MGRDFDLSGLAKVWWVTMCVMNRSLPYSMSDDILWIILCRGLVSDDSVSYLLKRKVWEAFYKLSQDHLIVDLKRGIGGFDICEVFACFLVESWPLWMVFFEAPFCVHFCLMNLVMIDSFQVEIGEREFEIVGFVCYHRAVQIFFELYQMPCREEWV